MAAPLRGILILYIMKTIKLLRGQIALVDDEDYEWAMQYNWHLCGRGYAHRSKNDVGYYMAIELMNPPKGLFVDHIDRNRLNNQRGNLRILTSQKNAMNRTPCKNATSAYKGVSLYKKITKYTTKQNIKKESTTYGWRACIRHDRKNISLGCFKTEREAALAYNEAAEKYFGEYANLNVIID